MILRVGSFLGPLGLKKPHVDQAVGPSEWTCVTIGRHFKDAISILASMTMTVCSVNLSKWYVRMRESDFLRLTSDMDLWYYLRAFNYTEHSIILWQRKQDK